MYTSVLVVVRPVLSGAVFLPHRRSQAAVQIDQRGCSRTGPAARTSRPAGWARAQAQVAHQRVPSARALMALGTAIVSTTTWAVRCQLVVLEQRVPDDPPALLDHDEDADALAAGPRSCRGITASPISSGATRAARDRRDRPLRGRSSGASSDGPSYLTWRRAHAARLTDRPCGARTPPAGARRGSAECELERAHRAVTPCHCPLPVPCDLLPLPDARPPPDSPCGRVRLHPRQTSRHRRSATGLDGAPTEPATARATPPRPPRIPPRNHGRRGHLTGDTTTTTDDPHRRAGRRLRGLLREARGVRTTFARTAQADCPMRPSSTPIPGCPARATRIILRA